ncbi:MAG TPA: hypothetical protein VF972_03890 [Actinomycetota bacterium]
MWVRGQWRALVNFDYVTAVEARVMESSYATNSEPKYEVIAYRRSPGQDAILLNMLDSKSASAVIDRIAGAIMVDATLVDALDLLEEFRYDSRKVAAAEEAAAVEAQVVAEGVSPATDGSSDEAPAITAT